MVAEAKARRLFLVDVVDALSKVQQMALRIKAARFLQDTGTETLADVRRYAADLVKGEEREPAQ